MKYLVLKKNTSPFGDPFLEAVGDDGPSFDAGVEELGARDAADRRRDPGVEDVIPSIPFSLVEPLDAAAPDPPGWGIEAVGAATAPEDGDGVTVAVLDTGIDTAHPAFAGLTFDATNLMDFTTNDAGVPGAAPDQHGHGTHVAGTIFGRDVGGVRIGVARGVRRVLIGKVLGPQGGPTEAVFNAMQWALNQRADVISMSLGINFPKVVERFVAEGFPAGIAAARALEAYRSNVRLFDRLSELIAALALRGRGAVVVAATGNESRRDQDPRFTVPVSPPAAADGFVSVGALARTGAADAPFAVAPFSNTGCVLAGPGVGILSARITSKGGGLVEKSGTSMATPHVAGVAALWVHRLFPGGFRPPGWARDVQRRLESTAAPLPGLSRTDIGLGIARAPG